jgi:hypothetical protein
MVQNEVSSQKLKISKFEKIELGGLVNPKLSKQLVKSTASTSLDWPRSPLTPQKRMSPFLTETRVALSYKNVSKRKRNEILRLFEKSLAEINSQACRKSKRENK